MNIKLYIHIINLELTVDCASIHFMAIKDFLPLFPNQSYVLLPWTLKGVF